MAGLSQIDLERQSQDATLVRAKLVANFLAGSDLDLTAGNADATITGIRNATNATDATPLQQVNALINAALTGSMNYKGTIDASDATGATLDGALLGDFYYVSVAGTLDGIAYNVGDHLVVNADITDFDVDGSGKIDIIDNTESLDILRLGDIVNDLVTGGVNDVLSAEQGVVIKGLIDALQAEVDATQAGAGLNTDGTYNTPSGSNYIDASTSLASADALLDAQIKVNEDAIAAINAVTEVYNEEPAVTGGSPTVSLANTDVSAVRVYLNGLRQLEGGGNDYTINLATGVITFNFNLKNPKDTVLVDYKF